MVQGNHQALPGLLRQLPPLQGETADQRVVAPGGKILLQIIGGIHQVDPPAQMVQKLLQHPPLHRVLHPLRRRRQQSREGVRRPVQGGAPGLLQLPQHRQPLPGDPVEIRPPLRRPAVGAPQSQGGGPVLSLPPSGVRQGVPQLPPGEDDALIRRQLQRPVPRVVVPLSQRMGDAPPAQRLLLFPARPQEDG